MLVGKKKCHCCGHDQKIYRYFLDDLNVSTLLKIWDSVIEQGKNEVKVQGLDMTYGMKSRTTQLRYLGLLQKVKNEKGKHKSGQWLITKRGSDFLHGRKAVPYFVWTMNNRVIPRETIIEETKEFGKKAVTLNEIERIIWKKEFRILKNFNPCFDILGYKLVEVKDTIQQGLF